ncbi:MAG: hypothetical protein M0Q51_01575 [Bacteroidales bacterium]|nr:hypothetical protein [Bacteroidales bacterium]
MKTKIRIWIYLFIVIGFVILNNGCTKENNNPIPSAEFEGGKKFIYDYVPTVVLSGSWQQKW